MNLNFRGRLNIPRDVQNTVCNKHRDTQFYLSYSQCWYTNVNSIPNSQWLGQPEDIRKIVFVNFAARDLAGHDLIEDSHLHRLVFQRHLVNNPIVDIKLKRVDIQLFRECLSVWTFFN